VTPSKKNAILEIDPRLTYTKSVGANKFIFHTEQSNLIERELSFEVVIASSN